jgi:hypothetical protein
MFQFYRLHFVYRPVVNYVNYRCLLISYTENPVILLLLILYFV